LKKINQFKDSRFSIIASGGIKNTLPDKEISLPELVAIYQNKAIKEICKKISIETDPIKRKELKLLLPYITPHGTFIKRADELITSYNKNILAIDIDYIKPGAELKKVLTSIDTNDDGQNIKKKLKVLLSQLGEAVEHAVIDEMIKIANVNGDGKVDFNEFFKAATE
jgi:Ca2+-binding EF-hand superfamily protein